MARNRGRVPPNEGLARQAIVRTTRWSCGDVWETDVCRPILTPLTGFTAIDLFVREGAQGDRTAMPLHRLGPRPAWMLATYSVSIFNFVKFCV
jgi:hypothetical protein